MAIIEWLTVAAFTLLGLLALRLWRRHGTRPVALITAAFGLLALMLLVNRLVPDDAPTSAQLATSVLSVLGVVGFPYLLFHFAASLGGASRMARWLAGGAAAAVLVVALVLVTLLTVAELPQAGLVGLQLAVLVYWTGLTTWAIRHLWRAGRGRPAVARHRLRALALSSGLLNVALLVALLGPEAAVAADAGGRLLAVGAAAGFYLAVEPPGFLRHEWRRADERRLRSIPLDVLRAEDRAAATNTIVPAVAGLFGTNQAIFLDPDARALATLGLSPTEVDEAVDRVTRATTPHRVEQHGSWIALRLETGWLGVRADGYAPFFDSEEMELLGSVGAFIDLALERVTLLAAERESKRRIEETSREVEALLYGISHDLRNPLVSVLGYLDLVEADAADRIGDEPRRYLERLRVNAQYMDALIGDLLELSRIGRTEHATEAVPLVPLVTDVAAELRRTHPAATIAVGALPTVDMNPVRARQLFANLLGNALLHSGREDVAVSVDGLPAEDGQAVVVVADDGKGIPEEHQAQMFGIFERLEPHTDGRGTGIGLAMCQRIVKQVGGGIWFGDPPTGAAVHVALPLAREP